MSSSRNHNIKRMLSALFGISVAFNGNFTLAERENKSLVEEANKLSESDSSNFISKHPVLTSLAALTIVLVAACLIYDKVNSSAPPSIDLDAIKDVSSKVPVRLLGLRAYIDEELNKLSYRNKKNNYSVFRSGVRRIVAGYNNISAAERALASSDLYNQEKRDVTCWDASLAFLSDINLKYGCFAQPDKKIVDMKLGLMSYDIPVTLGLANHVFCYVIAGNTLFIVDPLLGAVINIDLKGDREKIIKQISTFYLVQAKANVMPGFGNLYNLVDGNIKRLKNFFANKNNNNNNLRNPFGDCKVFISDNIFIQDINLSEVKWTPDTEFFGYLLAGAPAPKGYLGAPGALFG